MSPSRRTKWGFVWAGWVVYFVVAERIALRSALPDAPLTSHMRFVLGAKSHPAHRMAGQLALAGGVLWLADHLYRHEAKA